MFCRLKHVIFCLNLTFLGYVQGLQVSLDRSSDRHYCGHFYCWAHNSYTDPSVLSVVALTIYDITQLNTSIKLASLFIFDPSYYIDPAKINEINVTGHISWNSAGLDLALRSNNDCVNGSFLCELEFVNLLGRPDIIRQTSSPGSRGDCLVLNKIAQAAASIDAHVDEIDKENAELKYQLDKFINPQVTCTRRASYKNAREKFLIWGRVVVLCDTETDGGGWIIILRRTNGNLDFYRDWDDYKKGFGTPDTDFWIGNDIINSLTSQGNTELRVDMEYQGKQYFAHYSNFSVANETLNYSLSVSGYDGNAGDSLTRQHNGQEFTTYDRDHDTDSSRNCANLYRGGWWFGNCRDANLNGLWGATNGVGVEWTGVTWYSSLTLVEMKIRGF